MIRILLALLAATGSGIQTWLVFTTGDGFCINDGCAVVEKLTTVSSLYFYGLGTLFFLAIAVGLLVARLKRSKEEYVAREAERYVGYLLTAGMAAEGVLIFFQYAIAHAFCGSCLMVFTTIVLLTLLSGKNQIMRGIVAFVAVLIAAFALQFNAGGGGKSLTKGTMAIYAEEGNDKTITLIFSEDCPYCEKVVEFLQEESYCNIRFNPIEKRTKPFNFPGAQMAKEYDPSANIGFMQSIGLGSIPILIVPGDGEESTYTILNGNNQIMPWIEKNCRLSDKEESADAAISADSAEESSSLPIIQGGTQGTTTVLPGLGGEEDGKCKVGATDC